MTPALPFGALLLLVGSAGALFPRWIDGRLNWIGVVPSRRAGKPAEWHVALTRFFGVSALGGGLAVVVATVVGPAVGA